mmetsp:Transcript_35666/g.111579  ORF Transcript_35666/g.111579 Transcript_35666/m.111579 type:complete len:118 (-) Transcript_35666:70-423(-)
MTTARGRWLRVRGGQAGSRCAPLSGVWSVLGTTRISHLFLASNEISSIGATILVEAIKKRESAPQPISRIDLSQNPISDPDKELLALESGGKLLFGSSAKSAPLVSYFQDGPVPSCK